MQTFRKLRHVLILCTFTLSVQAQTSTYIGSKELSESSMPETATLVLNSGPTANAGLSSQASSQPGSTTAALQSSTLGDQQNSWSFLSSTSSFSFSPDTGTLSSNSGMSTSASPSTVTTATAISASSNNDGSLATLSTQSGLSSLGSSEPRTHFTNPSTALTSLSLPSSSSGYQAGSYITSASQNTNTNINTDPSTITTDTSEVTTAPSVKESSGGEDVSTTASQGVASSSGAESSAGEDGPTTTFDVKTEVSESSQSSASPSPSPSPNVTPSTAGISISTSTSKAKSFSYSIPHQNVVTHSKISSTSEDSQLTDTDLSTTTGDTSDSATATSEIESSRGKDVVTSSSQGATLSSDTESPGGEDVSTTASQGVASSSGAESSAGEDGPTTTFDVKTEVSESSQSSASPSPSPSPNVTPSTAGISISTSTSKAKSFSYSIPHQNVVTHSKISSTSEDSQLTDTDLSTTTGDTSDSATATSEIESSRGKDVVTSSSQGATLSSDTESPGGEDVSTTASQGVASSSGAESSAGEDGPTTTFDVTTEVSERSQTSGSNVILSTEAITETGLGNSDATKNSVSSANESTSSKTTEATSDTVVSDVYDSLQTTADSGAATRSAALTITTPSSSHAPDSAATHISINTEEIDNLSSNSAIDSIVRTMISPASQTLIATSQPVSAYSSSKSATGVAESISQAPKLGEFTSTKKTQSLLDQSTVLSGTTRLETSSLSETQPLITTIPSFSFQPISRTSNIGSEIVGSLMPTSSAASSEFFSELTGQKSGRLSSNSLSSSISTAQKYSQGSITSVLKTIQTNGDRSISFAGTRATKSRRVRVSPTTTTEAETRASGVLPDSVSSGAPTIMSNGYSFDSALESISTSATTARNTAIPSWLPKSIVVQSSLPSSLSTTFSPDGTETLPSLIAPPTAVVPEPNSSVITIGFRFSLNFQFLVENPLASAQIFQFLPSVLFFPFEIQSNEKALINEYNLLTSPGKEIITTTLSPKGYTPRIQARDEPYLQSHVNQSSIKVIRIVPMLFKGKGYLVSVAEVYFPSGYTEDLAEFVATPDSELYNNTNPTLYSLASLIDPAIPAVGWAGSSSSPDSSSQGDPSASQSGSFNTGDGGMGSSASAIGMSRRIKIRLVIFLTCLVFGTVIWILSYMYIHRFALGRWKLLKYAEDSNENRCNEKQLFVNDENGSECSFSSPYASPMLNEKDVSKNHMEDMTSDGLLITGENTVYSSSHGLEYFVDEDGNFYYSGANLHSTSDETETTKDEELGNAEEIENYLYSGEQERSTVTIGESSYNDGSLELDEEGNFVISDVNIGEKDFSTETNNSNTIESYNNGNLYQLTKSSNYTEKGHPDKIKSFGSRGSYSDGSHNFGFEFNEGTPYAENSAQIYNQDTGDLVNLSVSIDNIDEFLYHDGDYGEDPFDIQIDDIDDGNVADVQVEELDELDEEIYKRLSKIGMQKSNPLQMRSIFMKTPAHSATGVVRTTDFMRSSEEQGDSEQVMPPVTHMTSNTFFNSGTDTFNKDGSDPRNEDTPSED